MAPQPKSERKDKKDDNNIQEQEEEEEENEPGEFVEGWVLRRPKTPKDWVIRWAMNSSVNGVPNIQRSRHPFRIVFWVLIVLVGTALTAKDVVNTFQQYFSYPINVVMTVELKTGLEFPAVTICNLNPVRKSQLYLGGKEFEDRLLAPVEPDLVGINSEEHHETLEYFHNVFSQLNESTQHRMGHRIHSMLMGCSFAGKKCSTDDFKSFLDAYYGNCFTFNSERDRNKTRVVHRAGPRHGLTLDLYMEPQEYVPLVSELVGFRVSVDNPEAMPFPSDTGVFIAPGQSTALAVRRVEVIRKKSPFPSKCWEIEEDDAINLSIYSQIYGYDYSEQACLKTCYQRHVIQDCGCGDPTIPMMGEAYGNDQPTSKRAYPCLTQGEEMCEEEIKDLAITGELKCNCSVACEAIHFNPTVSSALWPSLNLTGAYKEKLSMLYPDDPIEHLNPRETIARVQIFYPGIEVEIVEEQEAYTVTNLYSDLGGNFGFYLGLSIISMFEFFELIPDVLRSCYRSLRHKKKVKKHETMKSMKSASAKQKETTNNLGDMFKTDYYGDSNGL